MIEPQDADAVGVAHVPSPLQNVLLEALVPLLSLETGKFALNDPALPVVFWFKVGMSAATIVLKVGIPLDPLGAARKVLAVWLAKLDAVTDNVPPNVRFPLVVTVPDNVNPLTVPVPPTDVTVPEPPPEIVISPEPSNDVPFTVLMLVPETRVACFSDNPEVNALVVA